MEDFYPLRNEDIPELVVLVQEEFVDKDSWGKERKENAISFLLPLVIDLLENVERSRALKNTFQEEYGGNKDAKISDGFWKIVEAYLEENNGTGNLLRITEVLRSNGCLKIARNLEKMLLRYSLTASPESENVYSLSRDFLNAQNKDIGEITVWNVNSVEKALHNSVILEEIFKKLQLKEQKLFRLVSPTWMEETFSFWRRNARILIHVSSKGEDTEPQNGISLPLFLKLWKNRKPLEGVANTKGNEEQRLRGVEDYDLQNHPFRSYQVSYTNCKKMRLFSGGKTETRFWESCGHYIEDLEIKEGSWNTHICKKLLQDICPNLKRLDLFEIHTWENTSEDSFSSNRTNSQEEEDSGETTKKYDSGKDKISQAKGMKIAENLHTLLLDSDLDEDSLKSLLFICPNLKTLALYNGEEAVGALLSPVSNGEIIKLKTLDLFCNFGDFLWLRQYTEMLEKNKFDSLEYFHLSTQLSNARSPPFNLYAALAQLSQNLKTLELDFTQFDSCDAAGNLDWFMDLSPFAFPNLTKLIFSVDICFLETNIPNFGIKFDFGTLKGIPKLEKLEIRVRNVVKEVLRRGEVQCWVFEGARNRYLPTGVTLDYEYSVEGQILCNKLREFTFVCWSLNEEDIQLLSSWFPNLTRLEAEVSLEILPVLLENWPQLEKLVIRTDKLISLRKLQPFKEMMKHIRIFQRISGVRFSYDNLVELKEQNGWLFFSY